MITIHCVDVSGSMSSEQLKRAHKEVLKRFKPKDIVVVFSIEYRRVYDLERGFSDLVYGTNYARGGTDARRVLKFVQEQKAKSILYSDGMMLTKELLSFDELVKIEYNWYRLIMASHNMGSKRSRSKRKPDHSERWCNLSYWCKEPFTLLGRRHQQIQYDATLDHIVEVKNGGTNDISKWQF